MCNFLRYNFDDNNKSVECSLPNKTKQNRTRMNGQRHNTYDLSFYFCNFRTD